LAEKDVEQDLSFVEEIFSTIQSIRCILTGFCVVYFIALPVNCYLCYVDSINSCFDSASIHQPTIVFQSVHIEWILWREFYLI